NMIQPLTTVSMAGQFGAAIGAAFLMNDKVNRTNMISSAMPTSFGVTEPLLFSVYLSSLRSFGSGMVAGSIAGFITYLFDLAATGMGITFIPGLLLYANNLLGLIQYLIVTAISFVLGFILVQAQGKIIREEIQ